MISIIHRIHFFQISFQIEENTDIFDLEQNTIVASSPKFFVALNETLNCWMNAINTYIIIIIAEMSAINASYE